MDLSVLIKLVISLVTAVAAALGSYSAAPAAPPDSVIASPSSPVTEVAEPPAAPVTPDPVTPTSATPPVQPVVPTPVPTPTPTSTPTACPTTVPDPDENEEPVEPVETEEPAEEEPAEEEEPVEEEPAEGEVDTGGEAAEDEAAGTTEAQPAEAPATPVETPDTTTPPADCEPGEQQLPDAQPPVDAAPAPAAPAPATPAVPAPPAGGPAAPAPNGAMPAIEVSGNIITRGGQPWWFLGYNSFVWTADCGHDYEKMNAEQVDSWFASMRHDGRGAVRLFFYEGWDLNAFDAAVASAKKHNIYLIITLDDAIGGCGENDKDAGWFSNQAEVSAYQAHMETLLTRYQGETAIAWFEYFNEPGWEGGALLEFVNQMGAAADAIDPARLWSTGTQPPYALDGDANYLALNESPYVDIASLHEYDEGEVETNHGDDARANSAGKPMFVGEFGINASSGGGDCATFQSRAERFAAKAQAYTTIEGYAGALAWAWQPGNAEKCTFGNLEADEASQTVLRDTGGAGEAASPAGATPAEPAPETSAEPAPAEPADPVPAA